MMVPRYRKQQNITRENLVYDKFHSQCLSEGKSSKAMGDAQQFSAISNALRCVGVSDTEIREIYKIVSGVMAFGNVEFIDSGDTRGKWSGVLGIRDLIKDSLLNKLHGFMR